MRRWDESYESKHGWNVINWYTFTRLLMVRLNIKGKTEKGCLEQDTEGNIFDLRKREWPVPVAARSKASVCGRSPAEIVGSNPAGGMDVCFLWLVCFQLGVSATSWLLLLWSPTDYGRNFKNEEAIARVGPQRYRKEGVTWEMYDVELHNLYSNKYF